MYNHSVAGGDGAHSGWAPGECHNDEVAVRQQFQAKSNYGFFRKGK